MACNHPIYAIKFAKVQNNFKLTNAKSVLFCNFAASKNRVCLKSSIW